MDNHGSELSREPLWAIPPPIRERLQTRVRDKEYAHFLLCGLYSLVAVIFLVLFGFAAYARGELAYSAVIFSFAVATCLVYGVAWFSQNYHYTKHFLTLLMGALCLYLFYTGGTLNTGPLYYFIFPLVAVFLQGFRYGLVSVVALLMLTLVLEAGGFGFDRERYSSMLVIRLAAIYLIIAALTLVSEYFRVKAERELLLSSHDLSQLTYGDVATNLPNRRLMEKLLVSEVNRATRYPVALTIMLLEADVAPVQAGRYAGAIEGTLTGVLHEHLRTPDIAGRWGQSSFLVLLPETPIAGAISLGSRLVKAFADSNLILPGQMRRVTLSVGIAELHEQDAEALLSGAADRLAAAKKAGGHRVVANSRAGLLEDGQSLA